ncbi:MAG: metal ABC transporter permease [Clostridiales bacterium]|nr:metal ABC transporter permease [Clostridiales bacterium]
MLGILSDMMSYKFLIYAVVVGSLISLCASLLGVSLVLKRYSMIGDGLSHVGFGAMAIATALHTAPLTVAVPVVLAAAFLLLRISDNSKIKGDSAIALISTGALAVGVVTVSLMGTNIDLSSYMFGSILAVGKNDMYVSVVLSVIVAVFFAVLYNNIFAVTFDENFARATGINAGLYNMLISLLTAVTIVLGMRLMGALLISSLIIFPPLSSMRVFKSFRSVVISSAAVSIICFLVGMVFSYALSTPAGASIVCVNIVVFAVFALAGKIKSAGLKKAL